MRSLSQDLRDAVRLLRVAGAPRLADTAADKAAQHSLRAVWTEQALRCPAALPMLQDTYLRAFSQNGEDGCLLLLFAAIGTTNKVSVEIGAGDGLECNTTNLILNHGWTGLLVDGSEDNVLKGRELFLRHRDTWSHPPTMVHAWVTRDNINELIREAGFTGEIDLLSLDIDGVDYWIWEALDVVQPRVVVLEYNDIAGPDRSITVPYDEGFSGDPLGNGFVGASLRAFVNLGRTKGYRLVGVEHWGFNAFFVREGVGEQLFPERPVEDFFDLPKVQAGMAARWPPVADRPWQEV